jgi:hypothetical protein
METVRIRDPGWKKVGSEINIPDPNHWHVVYSYSIHFGLSSANMGPDPDPAYHF